MTPTRVQCVFAAMAVVAAAGCGSSSSSGDANATSESSNATTPTQAFGPTYAEGVIEKKIGEPAGLNCPDEANKACDLNFTVTAIQQGVSCSAAADQPGPDQQFLRFDIDAFSSKATFEFPDSADALLLRNWSVDGAAGSLRDLVAYPECGDGAPPVAEPVAPGVRAHAQVVVRAPKPAEKLRVSWFELVWEWKIAGAG